ncbi:MAG: hypothetical protein H0X71_03025 [Rubrobacter sp.]|nr:hypothetical protein [Rubrobacter sp.]
MDEKYGRPESRGLDSIIRSMRISLPDAEVLTHNTDTWYDGLYACPSRETL